MDPIPTPDQVSWNLRPWGGAFDRRPQPGDLGVPRVQAPVISDVEDVLQRMAEAKDFYTSAFKRLAATIADKTEFGQEVMRLQRATADDVKMSRVRLRSGREHEDLFRKAHVDALNGALLLQPDDGEVMARIGTPEPPMPVMQVMTGVNGDGPYQWIFPVEEAFKAKAHEFADETGRPVSEFSAIRALGMHEGKDGVSVDLGAIRGGMTQWLDRLRDASDRGQVLHRTKPAIFKDSHRFGLAGQPDDLRHGILKNTAFMIDRITQTMRAVGGADVDAQLAAFFGQAAPDLVRRIR